MEIKEELKTTLEEQMRSFREKFGKDPGPGDPVSFDPDSETPQPLSSKQIEELGQQINQ